MSTHNLPFTFLLALGSTRSPSCQSQEAGADPSPVKGLGGANTRDARGLDPVQDEQKKTTPLQAVKKPVTRNTGIC